MSWYRPFNLAAHRSRGKKGPTRPSLIWRDGSPFFYPGATVSAKIIQIGTSSKTTWKGSIRPQTPISLVFFSWPLYQKKIANLLGVLSHLLSLGFPMVSKMFLRVTNLLEKVESTHKSSPCLDVLSQNPPPQVGGGNLRVGFPNGKCGWKWPKLFQNSRASLSNFWTPNRSWSFFLGEVGILLQKNNMCTSCTIFYHKFPTKPFIS